MQKLAKTLLKLTSLLDATIVKRFTFVLWSKGSYIKNELYLFKMFYRASTHPFFNVLYTRWHCSLSCCSSALLSPLFHQNLKQSNCLRQGSESLGSEWRMSRSLFIRVPHISLLLFSGFGTQPCWALPTSPISPQNNEERRRNSAFRGIEECNEDGNEGGS